MPVLMLIKNSSIKKRRRKKKSASSVWPGYFFFTITTNHIKSANIFEQKQFRIQIFEEFQVLDIYGFVATIGGSLGLFLGILYNHPMTNYENVLNICHVYTLG